MDGALLFSADRLLTLAVLLALFTLFFLAVVYLSVLAHELGHALAARLVGCRVTSFGLGTAKPLLALLLPGGVRFYLGREQPLQGLTWILYPWWFTSPWRDGLLLLGGPLTNLLLALLGIYWLGHSVAYLQAAAITVLIVNATFALVNLLPLTFRIGPGAFRSDGAQLLALLRRSRRQPTQSPGVLLAPRPLWESIGDYRILRYQLLTAALAALELENRELARKFFVQSQEITAPGSADEAGLALVVEGWLLCQEGDQTGAARLLYQARERFIRSRKPEAVLWVDTLCPENSPENSPESRDQEKVLSSPPALQNAFQAALILRLTGQGVLPEEGLLARYDATRRMGGSDTQDLRVYRAIARTRERQGDSGGAAVAYEQALRAVLAVSGALKDDGPVRSEFIARSQPLWREAIACLGRLGRQSEAEQWESLRLVQQRELTSRPAQPVPEDASTLSQP